VIGLKDVVEVYPLDTVPDILITADVALDPYRRDGHDGIVQDSKSFSEAILRY
jgi:delta-aminolevulinic acid dehydratase/porphobilinogen synthase